MSNLISHKGYMVIIRKEYLDITNNNIAASIILSILEHWTNSKNTTKKQIEKENEIRAKENLPPIQHDLWIYKTNKGFVEDSLNLLTKHKVENGIKFLLEKNFIGRRHNPKYKWDRTWQYKLNIQKIEQCIDHQREIHLPVQVNGTPREGQSCTESTYKDHMSEIKPSREISKNQEIHLKLSDKLISLIKRNKPDYVFRSKDYREKWATQARYMIDIDKRDLATIEKVMEWALSDSFWMKNILSMQKLREKFDMLEMKYKDSLSLSRSNNINSYDKEEGDRIARNAKILWEQTKKRMAKNQRE